MPPDTYPTHTDFLPQAIRRNDEQVLQQLYTAEYAKTEKYVMENSGTKEQAKDIFQEAFVAVWRNVQLGKFEPATRQQLTAYLYQVARNKWIDYLRSGYHKNMIPASQLPEAYDVVAELPPEEHQYLEAMKTALKQLGENCRELLQRFYYRNEPVQTIAEAMDWTEATVRNNKYRCMERLRQMLKKN